MENINLYKIKINKKAIDVMSKDMVVKHNLFPFYADSRELHIACCSSLKNEIIKDIEFLTEKIIKLFYASEKDIQYFINSYYYEQEIDNALEEFMGEASSNLESNIKEEQISVMGSAPVVRFIDVIINQAINKRASDIHIEPFEYLVKIRYRIDGILYEVKNLPKEIYPPLCTRLKLLSSIDITEKRIPQDGKFEHLWRGERYDIRVSSLPTTYGEKLVMRILYKNKGISKLESLGFSEDISKLLRNILNSPYGILLVTGPTGSGKSTTLYAMLNELDKKSKNIITIEDPVEYDIPGVNQVNVNTKAGLTFSSGLRSILRQDPNVIMLGEIRDEETAQIAVRAAITGHLVISTLHTNDSISAISRLIDMGVPKYLISDALICSIAQRLVRLLCPNCKVKYKPSSSEREVLCIDSGVELFKPKGCGCCNYTGYEGRTVVYELLHLNSIHKKIISEQNSIEALRDYCKSANFISIPESCKSLLLTGYTSYEELLRLTI